MAGIFQPNVFQGGGVFQVEPLEPPTVGSSISGGTFSRGQWRKIKEDEERARLAAKRRLERIEREAREAAQRKAAEERSKVAARRSAEDAASLQRANERQLAYAPAVESIMQAAQDAAAARMMADRARAQQEDEEEAIALLLLSQ